MSLTKKKKRVTKNVNGNMELLQIHRKRKYPLLVTMHFIPAAFAAARPMALSSTTTQLQKKKNTLVSLKSYNILGLAIKVFDYKIKHEERTF